MPLIHRIELGRKAVIGIWEVVETEAELLGLYPANESESTKLNSFLHAFRRSQFLASRLLLHTLLPGARIVYDENGKPFPDLKNIHISLSHSGKLIAMMIAEAPCGIDIETVRPKIEKIASKFLSEQELSDSQNDPITERLHVYWCVKEAIYKVYGKKNVSLKTDIFVQNVINPIKGKIKATLKHEGEHFSRNVCYEKFGDCMLAFTEQPGE